MGDVGSARYEPALLPPFPTIRVLSYSDHQRSTLQVNFRNLALRNELMAVCGHHCIGANS